MIKGSLYRNEWKYLCRLNEWADLSPKLGRLLYTDSHSEHGRYSVHSLYFDDLENSGMLDNNAGSAERLKIRFRYYGDDIKTLHLECKKKLNGRCRKLSVPVTEEELLLFMEGRVMELFSKTGDPLLKRFCLYFEKKLLSPRVIIDYERTAYVEEALNLRVTYDENITSSTQVDYFLSGGYTARRVSSGDNVLEVKFDEILPGYIKRIIEGTDIELTSFSKYYLARSRC
ncbi:MAG: polyphosphate polymerase domain-containing protein [Lachnospiraceae bacterium]|nr:polyphosphate polymerase domain-containing protein [Lachnospiraceae bacterium]